MTHDFKALHEELIHSVDWAASNQVAWTRNNRKALLAALELAQQAEETARIANQRTRDVFTLEAENASLKASMLKHFNEEHLAGDGPEIDRWKRENASLMAQPAAKEREGQ